MPDEQAEVDETASATIYLPAKAESRLHQGELLAGVHEWAAAYKDDGSLDGARPIVHRLAIVLAQDCDLEQDWRSRQDDLYLQTDLRNVLFCPVWPAEDLRSEHGIDTKFFKNVRQNKIDRYQYLAAVPKECDAGDGHPPMLVDFKSYFTVRTVEAYRQLRMEEGLDVQRRCRLGIPWREHLQGRFAAFLGRVGLPVDHFVPEGRRPGQPPPVVAPAQGTLICE